MHKPILCLLLIISTASLAQEKKLEIDFKSPKSAMGMYDTYSFVNKERNKVCMLAVGGAIIRGYILSQDYALVKEFASVKNESRRVLVGGYFKGDTVHYLLAGNENDDEIDHYTYDPAMNISNSTPVDLGIKRSMFLGGLNLGDQFLFVTVRKKEDKIMVYRFGKNATHEVLTFAYPASSLARESLYYAFSREWTKSARFKTLMDKSSFEKTSGEIEKPLEERIETFTKDIRIPEGCEGVFPLNKKLAYYYLDRKAGKLVVAAL
ncbi:MAG: hypothetical protein WDO16_14175 [Bacteroidota bacterium]